MIHSIKVETLHLLNFIYKLASSFKKVPCLDEIDGNLNVISKLQPHQMSGHDFTAMSAKQRLPSNIVGRELIQCCKKNLLP